MSVGLDWYKREPIAYLGDVQGLPANEHAVFSVVLDLLYVHGGEINNDPKWISGWISDMGSASVRNALASLSNNKNITLVVTEDKISQKRAKNQVKTKQKQNENAVETGREGGIKSGEIRRRNKENKDLAEGNPSTEIEPEKRREEKRSKRDTKVSPKKLATRLSEEWFLPQEWGEWAFKEFNLSDDAIRFEADKFKDYWLAKAGKDAAKLNWLATWRNWIRNSNHQNGGRNGKSDADDTDLQSIDIAARTV